MGFLKNIVLALTLGLVAGVATAGPGNPKDKLDYTTLAVPQETESGKRVEVIEFFGYYCPHCNVFDPLLTDWVEKQRDKIDFKRIHVVFRAGMDDFQQMYLTLEAMGKVNLVHSKIFNAMHKDKVKLTNENELLEFLVKNGIDREKYLEVYKSFSIQTKIRRQRLLQEACGVDTVPTIVVDGRFVTSPEVMRNSIGDQPEPYLHQATLQVVDALVARVIKERAAAK